MTAETAIVLPVLFVVLLVALTGVRAGAAELACQDAARAGARAAARGEPEPVVIDTARRVGPRDATVTLQRTGQFVRVKVRAPVPTLGPLHLPAFAVAGQAVAEPEPSR